MTPENEKAVKNRVKSLVIMAHAGHENGDKRKLELAAYQLSAIFGTLIDVQAGIELIKYAHDAVKECAAMLDI